jgi:ABC-2 type transport system permease protein
VRAGALKYLSVLWIEARQQLAYRGEFLMRGVMIATFMFVFISLWSTVYAVGGTSGEIAGYRLSEVLWYLAMTETIMLSGSRVYDEISLAVKSGDVAYALVRPYSYLGYQLAHSLGTSLPRAALNLGIAALVVLPFARRVETSLAGVLGFVLLGCCALLLDATIALLMGLAAFYLEEVHPLHWIYSKLLMSVGGMFLPLEMFPAWLRRVSEWLPFRLIVYAPARTFVSFEWEFVYRTLVAQLAYLAAMFGVLAVVWHHGKRRIVVHGG